MASFEKNSTTKITCHYPQNDCVKHRSFAMNKS